MLDHTGLNASDYEGARAFDLKPLAPLGYQLIKELPGNIAPKGALGLGVPPKPDFWIAEAVCHEPG